MAFRWHANDGPTLNAGLVAATFQGGGSGPVLLENPIFLRFFRGGGSGPSGSAHDGKLNPHGRVIRHPLF